MIRTVQAYDVLTDLVNGELAWCEDDNILVLGTASGDQIIASNRTVEATYVKTVIDDYVDELVDPIQTIVPVVGATGRIAKLAGSIAAGNLGDGYGAVEVDVTLTGVVAGHVAGLSSWVNLAASSDAGSEMICAQNNGIYVSATGTPMDSATAIIGMRMQYIADGGGNPGALYLFSTNIYDNALTAMFHVNAAADITWVTGAKSTNAASIPLFRDVTAGKTWYVNVYDG